MAKVGILTSVHNPLDTRIFHKQAVSLTKAEHDVTIIAHHDKDETKNGINIKNIGTHDSRIERWWNLQEVFTQAKTLNADIYHIHDPELLPVAVALKRSTGSKIIYDVHENYHASILGKEWIPSLFRSFVAETFDVTEAELAQYFDGIIVASDEIHSRFNHHNNVITITNYPLKRWLKDTNLVAQDRDEVQIVYCGKITRQRAIPELIEATKILSQYQDIELVIGGSYTTKKIQKIVEHEAKEHRAISTVGWLPTIDDVIDLFYQSDIGAMLIKPDNENQIYGAQRSNKTFQYMSTGTAIIGTAIGNWPKYIEKENCGECVDTESVADIVSGLNKLVENYDLRKKMGENGQSAVRERYNWENEETKLLDFYNQIS